MRVRASHANSRQRAGSIVSAMPSRAIGWIALCGLGLVFGFALVLFRGEPIVASDQGVFLSVAARMLDGDRLYAEVVDNKDPLFFYTYAAALAVGGWRGPFLLDGVWLGLAGIAIVLLARELHAPRSAVVTSFFVYPFALTAGWYGAGLSMLGALAVAPLAPWLWLRGRFAASGLLVAVAMLLKINLFPLVVAPLCALVVMGIPPQARWRGLVRGAFGMVAGLVVAAVLLALRGELRAYVETIGNNVHYSTALTKSSGALSRIVDHLRVAFDFFHLAGRWQLPAALLVLGCFAAASVVAWVRGGLWERAISAVGVATLVGGFVVLALTAYWNEHLQLLAYPATFIALALIAVVAVTVGSRAGAALALLVVAFAAWSSLKNPGGLEVSSVWTSTPISAGAIALERAHERLYPDEQHIPYMVFGSNSENGHAAFISDEFDLACRWFQLYPFSQSQQFDETLDCAKQKRPRLVLVTLGFFETRPDGTPWAAFVSRTKRFLNKRYELVETEPPGFQVWNRR
jgi:hypothetical protein